MIQYFDATFHILSLIRFDSMPIMRLLNSWVSCSINKLSYLPMFQGAVRCLILSAAALEHMEGGYLTSSTKDTGDPTCYPSKVAFQLTSTKPPNQKKEPTLLSTEVAEASESGAESGDWTFGQVDVLFHR